MSRGWRRNAPGLLWLLLLGLSSACASSRGIAARPVAAVPDSANGSVRQAFLTTFWCGPPLKEFDDRRAAEIAEASFTVVGPPCEGTFDPTLQVTALDVAARHGLKMWVADPRFNERARSLPEWEAQTAAAVALYKGHEALGGYFVTDEPNSNQFDNLAAIVAKLRALDPGRLVYINLLPDYIPGGFPGLTYREYVERFVTTVHPSVLSYDYYPFGAGGDRQTFFENLSVVRQIARNHGLPFMLTVQAMPHGPYRDPTEAELSWQVLHALAYGARGISYFAYWTPVNVEYQDVMKFRNGLIEQGKTTSHYEQAKRLNLAARALARELETFESSAVLDATANAPAGLPAGPVAALTGGRATIGLFENADVRRVLVVNQDYRNAATLTIEFVPGERLTQRFDPMNRVWQIMAEPTITLPAGGAALLQ